MEEGRVTRGRGKRRAVETDRRVQDLARIAYLAVIWLATVASIQLDLQPVRILDRLSNALAPTVSARDAVDAARNVVLFAGWGLVWIITARGQRPLKALRDAVLTGALLSLSVEVLQLFSGNRTPSALDLATNTGGALVGAAGVLVVDAVLRARRKSRSFVGLPALVFGVPYVLAVLGEALVPAFRQVPLPGVYGGPQLRFSAAIDRFDWASVLVLPLEDLLLFVPAGFLAVAVLVEEGLSFRSAAGWVAGVGAVVAFCAEVAHGALGLPIQAGPALVHAVAIALGAVLAGRFLPPMTRRWRGQRRAHLLLVTYAGVLLLWALRPYVPEIDPQALAAELSSDWWVPLRALAERGDVYSVGDVAVSFLLYLPIGGLLAIWPARRSGPLAGPLPGLYLAVATELAQLFVAFRTLDITDIMVQAAGVAVGWVLLRRAGFQPRDGSAAVPEGHQAPSPSAGSRVPPGRS